MLFSGKVFAALLAVAAVGVTGSPSAVELEKRDGTNVRYCDGEGLSGNCRSNTNVIADKCYSVNTPNTEPLSQVGTFAIYGSDGTICGFYTDYPNCNNLYTPDHWSPPGVFNLIDRGQCQFSAYQCGTFL